MSSTRTAARPVVATRRLARRAGPWAFVGIYLVWAYLWWSPILTSGTSVWSGTNLVLFLVGGASPLLAAVLLAWLTGGLGYVKDLGRRLVDARRVSVRWWLFVVLYWLAFNLVMAGLAILLGVTSQPFDVAVDVLVSPSTLAFQLALAVVFPAVEEIGLRGYYLDQLWARFNPTASALVNGATWAIWHAPFVLLPGYYDSITFDPALSWWLPMIVAESVLFVWIWEHTQRSILAVLVFHGMMNFSGELLGIAPGMYPFMLIGHLVAAAIVITGWQRRTSSGIRGPQ